MIIKEYFALPKDPADYLVSYPGDSLGKSCPSADMQSMYSTIPADWASVYELCLSLNEISLKIPTMKIND